MASDLRELLQRRGVCGQVRDYIGHFANEVRLKIFCELMLEDDVSVGDLVEVTGSSQPAVSQHLKHLRLSGLVSRERVGNQSLYRISDPLVAETMQFLGLVAERLSTVRGERNPNGNDGGTG